MRDFQKTALYNAEWQVQAILDRQYDDQVVCIAGSTIAIPMERKFSSIETVQRYVDTLVGPDKIKVSPTRSDSQHAFGRRGHISFPVERSRKGAPWALRETVVLHEIAHALNPEFDRHGPSFSATLVDLVERAMGPEASFLYKIIFHQNGIK